MLAIETTVLLWSCVRRLLSFMWSCAVETVDCSDGCRRLEETDEEHDFGYIRHASN